MPKRQQRGGPRCHRGVDCHRTRPLHRGGIDPALGPGPARRTRCSCSVTERRTWAEEFDAACRVAQAARRDGLGVGDRIAFLDRNGIAYFDFLFGGSLIGAVNVAVNWRLAPSEMAAVIDDSGARVLAIHTDYLPRLPDMPSGLPAVERIVVIGTGQRIVCAIRAPCPSTRGSTGARPRTPATSDAPDEVSMQLYTSGTTGLPKGVMLTNANLSTAIGEAGETFSISTRHREPRRHAAVPHRRVRLGAVRHVARRAVDHPARRRPDSAPAADRHRADHRDVRRARRADARCWRRRRWRRPISRASGSSSTARLPSPRMSWSSAWRRSAAASARSTG